jgi:hypothetical protein
MIPDFQPPPPPSRSVQLAALRAAFPGYTIHMIAGDGKPRYEAISRTGGNPYCLISTDVREIWRELKASA